MLVTLVEASKPAVGSVMVPLAVVEQLFASVIVTEYVPLSSPEIS